MKLLTLQPVNVSASQEKCAFDRQVSENALAARETADNQVVALTGELLEVKTTHAQELHALDAEIEFPKVLLLSSQNRGRMTPNMREA